MHARLSAIVLLAAALIVHLEQALGSQARDEFLEERRVNAQDVIASAIEAANTEAKKSPVLGVESLMGAFDDFAQAAQGAAPSVGLPTGLNVQPMTFNDVLALVANEAYGEGWQRGANGDLFHLKTQTNVRS